jgi:ribonuclease Z
LLESACRDADVLVHEATYTEDVAVKVGPVPRHSTAARVARFSEQVALPNLVLTHFSARYQDNVERTPSIFDVEQEARRFYTGRLFLACDLARYALDGDGVLVPLEERPAPPKM